MAETEKITYLSEDQLLYLCTLLQQDLNLKANDADLATVAKTGSYNSLSNKPTIPSVSTQWPISESAASDTATVSEKVLYNKLPIVISKVTATSTNVPTSAAIYTFVTNAIAGVSGFSAAIVDELPESGNSSTMYLVKKSTSDDDNNVYDEYFYINEAWELIGSTAMDLSGYVKTSDLRPLTNEEIVSIYNSAKGVTTSTTEE
jgi:hypothetical protein